MNYIDICIILLLLSFMAMGSKNGVIKELINFVGMIVVFILAYSLKGIVGHYICLYFPFLTFGGNLEGITTFNIFMYEVIAFLVTFGILLGFYAILVKGSEIVQKVVNMTIILKLPSKILGAIVGMVKCWVLLFVLLVALSISLGTKPIFQKSVLTNAVISKTPFLSQYTAPFTKALKEVYDVVEEGSKTSKIKSREDREKKQAKLNLKCLKIMLKYDMVDKETVLELIASGKLAKQKGMDEILNN